MLERLLAVRLRPLTLLVGVFRVVVFRVVVFFGGIALGACGGGSGADDDVAVGGLVTFAEADVVFGQAGFTGQQRNRGSLAPRGDGLDGPGTAGASAAAGPFFLPDIGNHRVLGFFTPPPFNNLAANFVLGQPGFAFNDPNLGAAALSTPVCAVVEGDRLFVSDFGNDRLLIWEGLPAANGAPASLVLGQSDMLTNGSATTSGGFDGPAGFCVAAGRILVADSGNNRILIWSSIPASSGVPADLVLGQTDFTSRLPNRGGQPTATGLDGPLAVWSDGTRIVVADSGNHRLLIWNRFPSAAGTPADVVVGQTSVFAAQARAGADGMRAPTDVDSDGVRLFVADAGNNRVLVFDGFPLASGTGADRVLGQGDFDHTAPNDDDQDGFPDGVPSARTLSSGVGLILTVRLAGAQVFVGDTGNNRVLIFGTE